MDYQLGIWEYYWNRICSPAEHSPRRVCTHSSPTTHINVTSSYNEALCQYSSLYTSLSFSLTLRSKYIDT